MIWLSIPKARYVSQTKFWRTYHDGSAWTTAHYGVGGLFTGTMHSIAFDSEDNWHTSYYSPSPANNLKHNKASQIYIVDDVIDSSPYGHDTVF